MSISQYCSCVGCCVSPHIVNVLKFVFILVVSATPIFGATLVVPAGGDLQSAINSAAPGDTIILEAGATYRGPFVLPDKPGDSYITIQSSRASEITGRISISQTHLLAKLRSSLAEPIIRTAPRAHHYKLIGLEISTVTSTDFVYDLVRLGAADSTQNDLSSVPHHLILDRLWIHGFETQDVLRGISLNSAETFIINSYISDIHTVGIETQAICGWNGPGPFTITNNYLEAAGENIMFGGAASSIPGLIPANINISQNHFFKPLKWKVGHPSYAGIHWAVKNLLELKNARDVVINGNIFENSWTDGQAGYAILFTVRGEGSLNPWNTLRNVIFSNNTIRNTDQGFQLLGLDDGSPSVQGTNLTISNNLLENVANWGFVNGGFHNVTLAHNTHFQRGNVYALTGNPALGFVSRDNITIRSGYGLRGDGTQEGTAALQAFCPGYVFRNNVVVGAPSNLYPPGNFYPANVSDVMFVDYNGGNYRLQVTSPYHNAATDGTDIGVDMTALLAAQAGAAPTSTPTPTPTPTPIPAPTTDATVQFSSTSFSVIEGVGSVSITVTRAGDTTGNTSVHYATSDLSGSRRSDYNAVSGTLTFEPGETSKSFTVLINDDVFVEADETFNLTLSDVWNGTLGSRATASASIIDNDTTAPTTNPLDTPSFFVRQHYVDFFNREPDAAGLAFWTNRITSCGADTACIQRKRVDVLEAFYVSIEFQETAGLVYRTYAATFGQNRLGPSVPLTLAQFRPDAQRMGKGIIVNTAGWANALEANKVAYFNDFVTRTAFTSLYPSSLSSAAFVDALNNNALGTLSLSQRSQLAADLNSGTKTRAQVLRAVVENRNYVAAEMSRAFVLMEYFNYLRRDPSEFPDFNLDGYNFWLSKLNLFSGSFANAEMVRAFVNSSEYRARFGP